MPTLFTRILNGEIPGKVVYEDDLCFAIQDIKAEAPAHVLIIPRKEIPSIAHATEADQAILGQLLVAAGTIARQLGVADDGYRLTINTGRDAGQTVSHIHVHLLGGRPFSWPPG